MIIWKAAGASGTGTSSASPSYPASIAAGNTLILIVINKYPGNGPATPSGWTLAHEISGGAGSPGMDNGQVTLTIFKKVADGTETGTLAIDTTGSSVTYCRINRYTSFGPVTVSVVGIANNVASTSWSAAFATDPGIRSGDHISVLNAINTDTVVWSSSALTTPGVTYGTAVGGGSASTFGDQCALRQVDLPTSAGNSTGASTYTMTGDSGTPSGAAVLVVLREDTVQYGGNGGAVTASTSLSIPYPTYIQSGDALVCSIVNKYPANGPTTPAGWTLAAQATGGSGASGVDAGSVYTTVFTRIADGTESGNLTVTVTSANVSTGVITRYCHPGHTLGFAASTGASNTPSTSWSATMAADPNIAAGSIVVAVSGINSDARSFSAQAVAATGCTFETAGLAPATLEIFDAGTTTGDDQRIVYSHHPCLTGVASAPAVYTMTASGTSGDNPAGSTVLLSINSSIIGSLAKTLGAATVSGTGTAPVVGSLAQTLGAATVAGEGTAPVVGALAQSLGDATVSGEGTAPIAGSLSQTLGDATASGTGTAPVAGTAAATLGDATLAGTGTAPVVGGASPTLGAASVVATGTAPVVGTLAVTLGEATLVGVGGRPVRSAQVAITGAPFARIQIMPEFDVYDVGDLAVFTTTFTVDGALADPTALTAELRRLKPLPAGDTVIYTYLVGQEIVRDSAGTYTTSFACTTAGDWVLYFIGTGTAKGAEPHYFKVREKPT